MRGNTRLAAAIAVGGVAAGTGAAYAQSGEITVWSWNIAASSLEAVTEGFNAKYPDVAVTVEDLGGQQVFDRLLAGCAAGGAGLPDVVTIENREAEIFWNRFPDCLADLNEFGYADFAASFPDFKRTELEGNGIAYAMPWDSGPVYAFYRRDMYEAAGVDPASIVTWDDWIAAGKQIMEANPGVVMAQADFNGGTEWFRFMAEEAGCGYFSIDGASITVNQPGCVAALEKLKEMNDAGLLTAADWGEKIQTMTAGKVATAVWGAWYEGTIRTSLPDQAGLWGAYRMPGISADSPRAANSGGSSLAITAASENKEAAFAFIQYALATNEGQITMLREYGLVPSLLSALEDPFVSEPQPFWGDQAIWTEILATQPDIPPSRGTPYYVDAESIVQVVQTQYLAGEYGSAQEALDDAAEQIASATGLPVM
jgi:lactose/L-arabinose transport system substrate-binding protein